MNPTIFSCHFFAEAYISRAVNFPVMLLHLKFTGGHINYGLKQNADLEPETYGSGMAEMQNAGKERRKGEVWKRLSLPVARFTSPPAFSAPHPRPQFGKLSDSAIPRPRFPLNILNMLIVALAICSKSGTTS